MRISALSIAILILAPSLLADTVTLTTTQNLGPSSAVTYVEVVSPGPTLTSLAVVSESPIFDSLGNFGVALPELNLPSGSTVTNATLQVAFTANLSDSGLFVVSSVPVDPTQPSGGIASPGSHFEFLFDTTNTAVGNTNVTFGSVELAGGGGSTSLISFDYTAPTESAVQTASPLAPITIGLVFDYGFQTSLSAAAASNTIATFNENFSFLSSPVVSTLVVDYTPPVPEPSSWTLAFAGGLALIFVKLWPRFHAIRSQRLEAFSR